MFVEFPEEFRGIKTEIEVIESIFADPVYFTV